MTKPLFEFCQKCGKKLKACTPGGMQRARAHHYRKAHGIVIQVVKPGETHFIFKPLAVE